MSGYERSQLGPAMRALSPQREAYIAQSAATKGGKVPRYDPNPPSDREVRQAFQFKYGVASNAR